MMHGTMNVKAVPVATTTTTTQQKRTTKGKMQKQ